jgi:hypothetical protein
MAYALAAMCSPLETTDVMHAANNLTEGIRAANVIDHLLRQGADLMIVRRVVEALRALRDAHVTDSDLAAWLIAQEIGIEVNPSGILAAAERVCQKLDPHLSRLVSPAGAQALLSRALFVARTEFPFLEGARAGKVSESRLQGLTERIYDIDAVEAGKGLEAVLGILLDLLVGFIGEDLTVRLVREVWPDLPGPPPGRPVGFDGEKAD